MADIQIFGEEAEPKRPLWRATWRGWRGRCPSCGEGQIYDGFVKTVDDCSVCGEHIAHHRADDLPPYLNIFITGHVIVGFLILGMNWFDWSPGVHMAIWMPITLVMVFTLMRPIKGAVIGLQWA
ncbi:MAG: DUF983 domain-containing protein, partial [Pseudomonadota bacterium]